MTRAKARRTYVDASVFGGVFDDESEEDSRTFFDQAQAGRFSIPTSALVADEISQAPNDIRELYDRILPLAELIAAQEDALTLQAAYLRQEFSRPNGRTTPFM